MIVNNAPRHCGTMVDQGYYFGASVSGFGMLRAAWYPFGDFIDRFIDCANTPAVGQFIGHFPLSAAVWSAQQYATRKQAMQMFAPEVFSRPQYTGLARKFGTLCLFDHVGANNYTPRMFVAELLERGPNRHTSPQTAREIAQLTLRTDSGGNTWHAPFPIIFTAKLPVFRSVRVRDALGETLLEWAGIRETEYTWEPTFLNGLSPNVDEYGGQTHFGTLLIHAMHVIEKGNQVQKDDANLKRIARVLENSLMVEQPFVGSTITTVHKFNGTLTDSDVRSGIVSSFASK